MTRLVPILTAIALLAAAPGTVHAQSPFSPLAPAPAPEPVIPEAPGFDEGISTTTLGLILLGVLVLLVAVGWLIMRDARRARPVDPPPGSPGARPGSPSAGDEGIPDGRPSAAARARAKKAREKQKAARKARKVTKRGR